MVLLLLLLLLLDELAWDDLGPAEPFFFFLLFDVGGRGAGFVFRPGIVTTGGGMTKVSILKLVMLGMYDPFDPGLSLLCNPGMKLPSRALAMAFPFDS